MSDPRFLHFLLLPLTWKQKDRFSPKRNRHPPLSSTFFTFRVDLQRNHGFGLPMAVPRYYGIRPRKVEFRVRYFQTVLRSFADQPEVGCVLVVIGLEEARKERSRSSVDWKIVAHFSGWLIIFELLCDIKFNNLTNSIIQQLYNNSTIVCDNFWIKLRCLIRIITKYKFVHRWVI